MVEIACLLFLVWAEISAADAILAVCERVFGQALWNQLHHTRGEDWRFVHCSGAVLQFDVLFEAGSRIGPSPNYWVKGRDTGRIAVCKIKYL